MLSRGSLRPSTIHVLAAINLPLLQQDHPSPLLLIRRINITTRLDAEPCPLPTCRRALDLRHINVLSRVELESRFSAVDLEMDTGGRVLEGGELFQWLVPCVEGDFGRILLDDEAVVDVRL